MKFNNLLYILSLIIIAVSIFLIIHYPNSGRMYFIAGGLAPIGFALNIASFIIKKK
jgi:hypothetical protein